jgi:hypothetical protein
VGGTVSWLSERTEAQIAGLTVSKVQAGLARDRLARGHAHRTHIAAGSFEDTETLKALCRNSTAAAGYMIESFVHASSPEAVFEALSGVAADGMLLVIIDDFPSASLEHRLSSSGGGRLRSLVTDFRNGWHITTFCSSRRVAASAASYGWSLEEEHDLTPYVDSRRPRDFLARAAREFLHLFKRRTHYFDNVVGGGALQRLIQRRATRYQMLLFRYRPIRD